MRENPVRRTDLRRAALQGGGGPLVKKEEWPLTARAASGPRRTYGCERSSSNLRRRDLHLHMSTLCALASLRGTAVQTSLLAGNFPHRLRCISPLVR